MSPAPGECDLAVVGAGIVGLAVARELALRWPGASVTVLERARDVAGGQTAANSGVVHAGIPYAPGSLKARLCVEGSRELYEYCGRAGVRYERCGKVIVARHPDELGRLSELERRGRENGVPGLRRLTAGELRGLEPHCRGVEALHSPATGVVDFAEVARALAREFSEREGAQVITGCPVEGVSPRRGRIGLAHAQGETRARYAVFCAGASADRLAQAAGGSPDPRIVSFRGAYAYLRPERSSLVRSLIYPVPDPGLPFLGVHLSRHLDGRVSVGPTALFAPRATRELAWPGTWRMARRWWRTGARELRLAVGHRALAAAAAEYVPELRAHDLDGGFAGVRAQALARDGRLVDDFVVSETERALHLRNAPSPAATSAFALARLLAERVEAGLERVS
ncbi:MAG TPA: L-2-hydroxyglutarate oxidase [Thermoleophilaceae bacterium]|nr:L-2-hydroxyglutarate oxidase [Thermoleophilaceae bacterium]